MRQGWRCVPRLGRRRLGYILFAVGAISMVFCVVQLAVLDNVSKFHTNPKLGSISQDIYGNAIQVYQRTRPILVPTPQNGPAVAKGEHGPVRRVEEDVVDDFPDVPVYLAENPHYHPSNTSKHTHHLCIKHQGGLGNQMFAYAAVWGIARRNHMRPVWPGFQLLRNYFHLDETVMTEDLTPKRTWTVFLEDGSNLYDDRTEQLNYDLDILLVGFYQSWRYFSKWRFLLHRHFRFRAEILRLARGYLQQAYGETYGIYNISRSAITYVGVHIRRGDMLDEHNVKKGYTVATKEYLESAMIFFTSRHDNVLFVVCSDDYAWSRRNVPAHLAPVTFSTGHYDVEDMAILSLCDHTVMTVGTFGWWAAWMAGGTVLYYADFPARNSDLEAEFNPRDVYPPHWKGMSFRAKRNS